MISAMEKRKSVGGGDGMTVLNKVVKVGLMEMVTLIDLTDHFSLMTCATTYG